MAPKPYRLAALGIGLALGLAMAQYWYFRSTDGPGAIGWFLVVSSPILYPLLAVAVVNRLMGGGRLPRNGRHDSRPDGRSPD